MSVIPRFLFLSGNLLAVHARLASGTAVVLWEITLGLNEADRPTAAATSRVGTLGAGEEIIYRGEENIYRGEEKTGKGAIRRHPLLGGPRGYVPVSGSDEEEKSFKRQIPGPNPG